MIGIVGPFLRLTQAANVEKSSQVLPVCNESVALPAASFTIFIEFDSVKQVRSSRSFIAFE